MAGRRALPDHVTIGVSDLARSRAFCERALAPLDPDGHSIEASTRV